MSFAFGFSGDDIEDDGDQEMHDAEGSTSAEAEDPMPAALDAVTHKIQDLVGKHGPLTI